jgi:hypothetical protein
MLIENIHLKTQLVLCNIQIGHMAVRLERGTRSRPLYNNGTDLAAIR